MTFSKYRRALEGDFDGITYCDGGKAREKIEGILGYYKPDNKLTNYLISWAESLLHIGVLSGVNGQKWKFACV
jgi:hypothetical protein